MRKLLLVLVMVVLVCGMTFSGYSKESAAATSTSAPSKPKYGGTFKYADAFTPSTSIGWIADIGAFQSSLWAPIFMDTLLKSDSKGAVNPCLATNYEFTPDLKSITLTLRQGVKFHDGSNWNATVAKWNLEQLIKAKMGDLNNVSSVDILGDYTIRLNVSNYTNTLLNTLGTISIVSKAAYDAHGGGDAAIEWMRFHPVGTGPFKLASYEPKVSIKGVKFDGYWQKGKPYLDTVEMYFIADAMTRAASLQAGEVDAIGGDLSKVEYDLQPKGFNIIKAYAISMCLIPDSKNTSSPLSSLKVRQAIDYAIGRNAIVKSLGYGFWTPTYQFAVPGSPCYNEGLERAYNPDKAKQLLAESGYPNGLKIQLIGSTAATNRDFAVAVQGYLSKVGINLELNVMDHGAYTKIRSSGWENGFIVGGMAFDGNMNSAINQNFTQTATYNPSMQKPDELQSLYNAAATAKMFDSALTKKVIKYIFDNAMFLPICCYARGQVMQPYIRDTGFYTGHNFAPWEPANTWLSK